MAQEEQAEAIAEAAEAEAIVVQTLGEKALGGIRAKQETALQVLSEDANAGRFTHLRSLEEAQDYARLDKLFLDIEAVGKGEWEEPTGGWHNLILLDFRDRVSFRRSGRKDVVDTTHILERTGSTGRPGILGRRRG